MPPERWCQKPRPPVPPLPLPVTPPTPGAAPAARWQRHVPALQWLRHYPLAWLPHDLAAGLALSAVLVPVGIAYAVASGLTAIAGLYATVFGLLAYAVFGPSRVLVLGPDSSLVALVLAVVLPLAAGDAQRALALAGMMAVVSGLVCIGAGWAKLGFVTELLSKPIRYGYMNGIALTVAVSQLPALCGFAVPGSGLLQGVVGVAQGLAGGRANAAALALGLGTLGLILLLRRWPRWPAVLMALVLATLASALLDLAGRAGVQVLGPLPQGLPALVWPAIGLDDLSPVLMGGLALALGVKGYHDITRYPQARQVPGLWLFRWDAPLFFANAEGFRDSVLAELAAAPAPVHWLVLGAEPITSVDLTAADMLAELDSQLLAAGTQLQFAELKDPVKDKLRRFGLLERLGERRFFATLGEAVAHYLQAHPVAWTDWQAQPVPAGQTPRPPRASGPPPARR